MAKYFLRYFINVVYKNISIKSKKKERKKSLNCLCEHANLHSTIIKHTLMNTHIIYIWFQMGRVTTLLKGGKRYFRMLFNL